jgi:hypothetical protein
MFRNSFLVPHTHTHTYYVIYRHARPFCFLLLNNVICAISVPFFFRKFVSLLTHVQSQDYMNYRKYRYLRLDGSSTIMDRRDMVRDFQLRLVFSLLSGD